MKKLIDKDRILVELVKAGDDGITSKDMVYQMGIMRAGARVLDLRRAGHDIRTYRVVGTDGKKKAYVRYVYVPPEETEAVVCD